MHRPVREDRCPSQQRGHRHPRHQPVAHDRRDLGRHHDHQPQGGRVRHQARVAGDASSGIRIDHLRIVGGRGVLGGDRGLQGIESRAQRLCPQRGDGQRQARYSGQRDHARPHGNTHGDRRVRCLRPRPRRTDRHPQFPGAAEGWNGHRMGHRQRSIVPGLRRSQVHHRRQPARRRRSVGPNRLAYARLGSAVSGLEASSG